MKKIYNILFVLLLFLLGNLNVSAEKYECWYRYELDTRVDLGYIEVDTDNKSFFGMTILDQEYDSTMTNEQIYQKYFNNGKSCPSEVNLCEGNVGLLKVNLLLFNGSLLGTKTIDYNVKKENCYLSKYDESMPENTKPSVKIDLTCESYDNLYAGMKKNYCNIGEEGCSTKKRENYNDSKSMLKSYCNQILSYTNYDSTNPCMVPCVNLSKTISDLEKNNSASNTCGFSDKLIDFVLNILKWVKYLVPALVIILSILDFIKAIGADKEDEMKKAQKKFITRLIIAALVFIAPFIIEFALDKMGFSYKGCGIF